MDKADLIRKRIRLVAYSGLVLLLGPMLAYKKVLLLPPVIRWTVLGLYFAMLIALKIILGKLSRALDETEKNIEKK